MRPASIVAATFFALTPVVQASVEPYNQCGGVGYTGDTVCTSGYTCTYKNQYYSQCLPAVLSSTSSSSALTPTTTTTSTTTTCPAVFATSTGHPIKAITPGIPISGLYLQRDDGGRAILSTTAGSSSALVYENGTISRLDYYGTPPCLTPNYLDVYDSGSVPSFKLLFWDWNKFYTNYWAATGQPIQTLPNSPYGVTSTFLSCRSGGVWIVYLQTGSDVPPGLQCWATQLQAL